MRIDLLDVLCCPTCRRGLVIEHRRHSFELDGILRLVEGALRCEKGHRFPVVDEVPRLVGEAHLTAAERSVFGAREPEAHLQSPIMLSAEQIEARIGQVIRGAYGPSLDDDPAARARAESEVAYQVAEFRGANKARYAELLAPIVVPPRRVLDVGGGLPGMAGALRRAFPVELAVVADLNPRFAFSAQQVGRPVEFVRADATALPFRPGAFDVVVSAFLLEHVPAWPAALRSMSKVGRALLVAFGPNRWFPFEIGHIDAPLAGTLPKPLAAIVAYVWLRATGEPRSIKRIREIMNETTYISSRQFRRECVRAGLTHRNMFAEFVQLVGSDRTAPPTGLRNLVRRRPGLARSLARLLVALGIEPNMYYLVTTAKAQTWPPRRTVHAAGEETGRHEYGHDGAYGGGPFRVAALNSNAARCSPRASGPGRYVVVI